jgi:hypothetical protein
MIESIAPFALVLSGITAGIIIVSDDFRIRITVLALQYICVAILVSLSIPLRLGIIKLITGLIVVLIFGLTNRYRRYVDKEIGGRGLPTGWFFKILAVLLVSTSALGIGGIRFLKLPGIPTMSIASSILLMGLGLLQLGLTEQTFGIGIGLLTLMSGFEIIYSYLEPSLAVMGLIASIHVGIAIVISILEVDVKMPQDLESLE